MLRVKGRTYFANGQNIGQMIQYTNRNITFIAIYLLLCSYNEILCQAKNLQIYDSFKIVIDAGHGGHDVGAIGISSLEKEITLSLALEIGNQLNTLYPNYEVHYTRVDDRFIPLKDRIHLANQTSADIFISIHCNSVKIKERAHGAETYVMGLHASDENLQVAKRENSSILLETDYKDNYQGYDPYSLEGHILLSAMQNINLKGSIALAEKIQNNIGRKTSIRNRGVKQAGFVLLRQATMPSVLIEAAFISDVSDQHYLLSNTGLTELAHSITLAIAEYEESIRISAIHPPYLESKTLEQKKPNPVIAQQSKITYRIQVASFKEKIDYRNENNLKHLENIKEILEEGVYKYFVGSYDNLLQAVDARHKLKEEGFNGAFVVAYRDDNRIKL